MRIGFSKHSGSPFGPAMNRAVLKAVNDQGKIRPNRATWRKVKYRGLAEQLITRVTHVIVDKLNIIRGAA